MKKIIKNLVFILLIFLTISALFALFSPQTFQGQEEVSFSQLVSQVNQGEIEEIAAQWSTYGYRRVTHQLHRNDWAVR